MSEGKKEVNVIIKALDETLPGFKSARTQVKSFADEAKGLIAEAFAGFTVFEFFKTAMEKAIESEQAYAQLSNTLANVGVNYETNRGKIDDTIKSLQKVANVRSDDAIKGFNTLVQRSGDYQGSLKNMVLVADLAKSKHLEFNEAAELVGRVMGGNTKVLRQYGIVTKDSAEGIRLLTERLGGAAAVDMATFGGQVEATKISFLNLTEAVGDVITGTSTLGGGMSDLRSWFQKLTDQIEQNRPKLIYYFGAGIEIAKELGRQFLDLIQIAFSVGETIGNVGKVIWYGWKSDEGKAALAANAELMNGRKELIDDMLAGGERLATGMAKTAERAEAAMVASASRLKANAARTAQELAERRAKEAEARQKEAEKAQAEHHHRALERIKDLEEEGKSSANYHAAQTKLFALEQSLAKIIADGTQSLRVRSDAEKEYTAALKARQDLIARDPQGIEGINKGLDKKNQGAAANELPGSAADLANKKTDFNSIVAGIGIQAKRGTLIDAAQMPQLSFMDALRKKWEDHRKQLEETGQAYKGFGQNLADIVEGPIMQFGAATATAMGAMIAGSKTAGQAFRAAMLQAIGGVAKAEGDLHAAYVPADLARYDFWAAGRDATAAGLFYAVSGAVGAMGGSGGGGGGGGGSLGQSAVAASNAVTQDRGKLTVVWPATAKAVLNINDPDDQLLLKDFLNKLAGNRDIEFVVAGS